MAEAVTPITPRIKPDEAVAAATTATDFAAKARQLAIQMVDGLLSGEYVVKDAQHAVAVGKWAHEVSKDPELSKLEDAFRKDPTLAKAMLEDLTAKARQKGKR